MPEKTLNFSQRHPFLFGFTMIFAAMILFIGIMALLRSWIGGEAGGSMIGSDSFGVVDVEGAIFESREVVDWIKVLRENDNIIGVLVRVDSPGGGVSPSQDIYRAVKKLAKKKPVVVSMGSVAASGGYYVSAPANKIFANPGTITGSIGVIMQMSNLMGLMDKIGVAHDAITSGKLKDAGSPYRELTPEERSYYQSIIDDLYDQFLNDVATARKISPEKLKPLADGRIYTGRQAHKLGLVDGLGGMDEAIDALKVLCKVDKDEEVPLLEGPEEETTVLEDLLQTFTRWKPTQSMASPSWSFTYMRP